MTNNPPIEFSPTIPQLIQQISAAYGDNEAIVRDGNRLTYRQLDEASAHVAKALLGMGLSKCARVAILLPPSPEFVAFLLGIGRIGCVAVPLSTLYQAPELQWVLEHAEIDQLIIADSYLTHDYLSRLETALPGLAEWGTEPLRLIAAPRLRAIHVLGTETRSWARDARSLLQGDASVVGDLLATTEALVSPSDPFCIVHTSGSTANPKGVIHGHGPFVRHSWQMGRDYYPFGPGARIVTTRAMFWIAGLVATLFYSLQAGSCLVTTSDATAENLLRLIDEENANSLAGDAGWFDVLREHPGMRKAGFDLVRLNMDMAAIARDGAFLCAHTRERYGAPVHYPDTRFPRTYGMTETLGGHTAGRWDELLPEDRPNWQGKPVPGVTLKLVDADTRAELPPGNTGELLVKGYCLMLGLNGRERDETFDAEGFYATGDICTIDAEGYVKFESRMGDMIKVHGANVAPIEVELAMTGLLGIEKAGLVALPHQGDVKLVAAVVMGPGNMLDEAATITALKQNLSAFKVPKRIVALAESDMPMTGSGKIRKAELVALLQQQGLG